MSISWPAHKPELPSRPGDLSELWLYVVRNEIETGSKESIDGHQLTCEGSAKLEDNEDPDEAALDLANTLGSAVAIVSKLFEYGDEVESFVLKVVEPSHTHV